ncbi:MAG: PD40 domain-containing protein, partial [Kiritimatiellae bacterium]|nr:PD40 domain-containing protein [Kiritimatiellia bacterium]
SSAADAAHLRDAAHALADAIVEEVAGKLPMARSHILFVGRRGGTTDVYECDADGRGARRVTTDGKLCLSPNWNPRSNSFMYTSWASGAPAVYQVDLSSLRRSVVSAFPGMNHGAVKSPRDGLAAVVLSLTGAVELYLVDPASRRVVDRLTRTRHASEASPAWSPDGRTVAYVSDEGGVPRCYAMDVATRVPSRLVWAHDIRESVAPEWSCTGKLAFCGRSRGRYGVYVTDPSRDPRTVAPKLVSPADGADYEDPSWAPDGRHIVCTRTSGYKRTLVVLDVEGDPPRRIPLPEDGDWYLPSWSDNAIR